MAEIEIEQQRIVEGIEFYMSHCENGNDCEVCLGLQIALKVVKGEI